MTRRNPNRRVAPRAACPKCGRATAVTFNARTGEAYLRPHRGIGKPAGTRCDASGSTVPRSALA